MNSLLVLLLIFSLAAVVFSGPYFGRRAPIQLLDGFPRFKRQNYFEYRNPSYSMRESQQWRYGGYGGNNGEGSSWEGTHPWRISNNDWALGK